MQATQNLRVIRTGSSTLRHSDQNSGLRGHFIVSKKVESISLFRLGFFSVFTAK